MDIDNLQNYDSYASFKTRCYKVIGENQERIRYFLQHQEREDFLLKTNVLWDISFRAREIICQEYGK